MLSDVEKGNDLMLMRLTPVATLHTNYEQSSRPHNLKNGVAQGSVLAPTLCSVYTDDFPDTLSTKCIYADDVALTFSAPTFSQSEKNLTEDMATVQEYHPSGA